LKKTLAIIEITVIFLFIYFFQVNFFSWFTIAGVKPNLFVIYVVVIGLFSNKKIGVIFAIIFGLFIDIICGRILGMSSCLLVATMFVSGFMYKNFTNDTKITMVLILALSTIFYEFVYYILSMWKLSINVEIFEFLKILCIETFFNSMLTIILYPAIQKGGNYLSEIYNKKNFISTYF